MIFLDIFGTRTKVPLSVLLPQILTGCQSVIPVPTDVCMHILYNCEFVKIKK